jgi:hypothetical protein
MTETLTAADLNAALGADPSGLPFLNSRVVFDDGRQFHTQADQRDMRRAMLTCGIPDPEADPLGFARAVAWSYLNRNGEISEPWQVFDMNVMFVIPEATTTADPTGPATAG